MSNVAHPRGPKQPAPRSSQRRQVTLPGAAKQKQKETKQGGVRGGLLLLGLLLVVASAGAFWYILRDLDVREEYLVTARTLERWDIAGVGDFTVVEANLGDAAGVPPEFLDVFVGKWATGRIPAGTIVTPGMFQAPPLSNEDEAGKVLIEVSLPAGEAPGGTLNTGDKIALFGAEFSSVEGLEGVEPSVGLIGVLELKMVQGDKLTYVVTPSEAAAIQDIVDRYQAASNRRIWKLGFDLSTQELIDLYGPPNAAPAIDEAFADLSPVLEDGGVP